MRPQSVICSVNKENNFLLEFFFNTISKNSSNPQKIYVFHFQIIRSHRIRTLYN